MSFANVEFTPAFAPDVTEYTAEVANATASTGAITLTATDSDATYVIKRVNTVIDETVGIDLNEGVNNIKITVTNTDGDVRSTIYTVAINRLPA